VKPVFPEVAGAWGFIADPVLVRFCRALDASYADQIERVVLFDSRARGDSA
jgi:hypothetical protein